MAVVGLGRLVARLGARLGPGVPARRLGDVAVFSAPLFLNFETPRGKYEAFEHYRNEEFAADQGISR